MKYARYEEKKHRRELWKEIVYRNAQMHIDKFPELKKEILGTTDEVDMGRLFGILSGKLNTVNRLYNLD